MPGWMKLLYNKMGNDSTHVNVKWSVVAASPLLAGAQISALLPIVASQVHHQDRDQSRLDLPGQSAVGVAQ